MAYGKGIPGVDYFVISDAIYQDLKDILGDAIVANFFQVDGFEGYWFAKQSDIYGADGVREYEDIINNIDKLNLGTAFFTRSTEPNFDPPGY